MKRGKKGQFFLISSLIIIAVLMSFITYRVYLRAPPVQYKIYDLGEELGIETGSVVDHGIYTDTSIGPLLDAWSRNFSEYSITESEAFVFIYLNEDGQLAGTLLTPQDVGGISVNIGTGQTTTEFTFTRPINIDPGETVTIEFGDFTQEITREDLEQSGGYYFIISGSGGEVASGRVGGQTDQTVSPND